MRIYLQVPTDKYEVVKRRGAKYDNKINTWYITEFDNWKLFKKFMTKEQLKTTDIHRTILKRGHFVVVQPRSKRK